MQSIGSPEVSALVREGRSATAPAGSESIDAGTGDADVDDTATHEDPCDATTVTPVCDPAQATPQTRRSLGYLVALQGILFVSQAGRPHWPALAGSHATATSLTHGDPAFPGVTRVLNEISDPSRTAAGTALAIAAALATLWLTGETARRLGSGTAGLIAAALLGASALFQITAASGAGAMLFVALVTWSGALFLSSELGTSERASGLRMTKLTTTGGGTTLAALGAAATHGLLGIVLPAIATVAFHAGEKALGKLFRPKTLALTGAALAVTAAGLGWLGESGQLDPFGQPAESSRWLYLRWLALLGLPLSVLAPFALYAHLKNRGYREDLGFADRRWRYPKAAFLAGFGVLCLTPLPRLVYLAAVTPPLAILVGSWIEHRWTELASGARKTFAAADGLMIAALLACLVLAVTDGALPAWIAFAVAAAATLLARGHAAHSTTGLALRLSTLAPLTALVLERFAG